MALSSCAYPLFGPQTSPYLYINRCEMVNDSTYKVELYHEATKSIVRLTFNKEVPVGYYVKLTPKWAEHNLNIKK